MISFMVWPGGAGNATPVIDWILSQGGTARYRFIPHELPEAIAIDTLEGTITASPGDAIIQGVAGEFYPCKPEIFGNTYEILEDSDDR